MTDPVSCCSPRPDGSHLEPEQAECESDITTDGADTVRAPGPELRDAKHHNGHPSLPGALRERKVKIGGVDQEGQIGLSLDRSAQFAASGEERTGQGSC